MSNLEDRKRAMQPIAVFAPYGSLGEPTVRPFREGQTVYEIMLDMRDVLPPGFEERGVIQINGHEIVRGAWHLVRPTKVVEAYYGVYDFDLPHGRVIRNYLEDDEIVWA